MIRNKDSQSKFAISLMCALIVHTAILALLKYDPNDFGLLTDFSKVKKNLSEPLKLNDIKFIKQEEVEQFRKVGIKGGKKDLQRPDLAIKRPSPPPSKATPEIKGAPGKLSLDKLTPQLPKPEMTKKPTEIAPEPKVKPQNQIAKNFLHSATPSNDSSHFYFNPKQQKVIAQSHEQELLKEEAVKNVSAPMNKATEKISNFEIRYERPEGVSEDELNSDEKAYYSFYVRSYQNYFSKIYSNYERIVVERPGLAKVFDRKHLLIGRIDYDQNGDIIMVKILKSSDSDDLHYFFEETLKQLTQPNPPKVFTKNRKEFSIYYQLQIN